MQLGNCNRRHAACNPQHPDNMRHAAGNMQRTIPICDATCNEQHAPNSRNMQRTTTTCNATDPMQQATGNGQRAAEICNTYQTARNAKHATCARLRATCGKQPRHVTQHATGNVHATNHSQRCKDSVQRTPGNTGTRGLQHAGNAAQKTASSRQRMRQTTCNRQQTTCQRTRAHARCNRQHAALPYFVCGEQRTAYNQQHARSVV